MFQRILLATDGSQHSIRATKHAIELAEKFKGSLDIVYVVDGETAKADVLHAGSKFEIEKNRKERLNPIKKLMDKSGVDYNTHILHGEAGPTIVDFANKNEFDCVVIGSRGLNDLQTFILGSVSHKVAKRTDCPVLIVK
ncbi:universal stress protein [Oceanobacillus sp. Castelsardo]|uniref:universal stress protein n=1 Tax=Oceanobacillus sp. Castelsardo TaxID=1851204 RepID=UPI0008382AAF|nr:universal stress protein [Oceanobacillus sp. Castelsardo]